MKGGKRRRGGDSLDEEASEQLCPQKKKKEGKRGVRYKSEGGSREPIGCGKEGESALRECCTAKRERNTSGSWYQ